MASARSFIKPSKRIGPVTDAEKDLVAKFVQDSPAEITPAQTRALAKTLRRTKETTIALIEEAKERLVDDIPFYIGAHKTAIGLALASETVAGLEQAIKGSQWALENISGGGLSVIEKTAKGPAGNSIKIGIKMGGTDKEVSVGTAIDAETV